MSIKDRIRIMDDLVNKVQEVLDGRDYNHLKYHTQQLIGRDKWYRERFGDNYLNLEQSRNCNVKLENRGKNIK